jgi:hypothetical protein
LCDLDDSSSGGWNLLLNIYVPMHDSILVVVAVALTLGAIKELDWGAAIDWIGSLSVLIFAVSWVSYEIARSYRIQLLSIAFAVLGLEQLYLSFRVIRQGKPQELSTIG